MIASKSFAALALAAAFSAAAADSGTLSRADAEGKIFSGGNYLVVNKTLAKGKEIGRHNHPGYEVLFVATKGSFDVVLDDGEKHLVRDGDTLKFGGNVYISGTARENAAATIILIKEAEQPKAAEPQ